MTQKIKNFEYDSKNWTSFWMWFKDFFTKTLSIEPFFLIWLTEFNPSVPYDSKNWTIELFKMIYWIKFLNLTRRIEPFFDMTWKIDFLENESNNSNPFWTWFTELNIHFEKYDSKNPTLLFNMTYRIKSFSSTWLIEIEPFFSTLLKELNPLFVNMTLRFELFSAKKYDSKNWTLGRKKASKNGTLFLIWLQE